MGMLTLVFAVAMGFSDAGFGLALVQRNQITEDDKTSVFCFNIVAGIALTASLCAISPLVSIFYRQPILKALLCVSSFQFVLISFSVLQYSLMMRNMEFKTRAILTNTATLLSGAVGVGMAWNGFGVWSLVGQALSRHLFCSALIWTVRPWRPRGRFSWDSIRSLWAFSSRLVITYQMNTVFANLYSVIIGRVHRPADLGQFIRAYGLAQLPGGALTDVIANVTLPTFSRMQNDTQRLKASLRKTLRTLGAFHFPLMIGLAAVADPLVNCLLTQKWAPCVPYLKVLSFCGMLLPLQAIHRYSLTALGRSDLVLRCEMIKNVAAAAVLFVTVWFGVMTMVWGILGVTLLCYPINVHYSSKLIGYTWAEQVWDLVPMFLLNLVMGASVWCLGLSTFRSDWIRLALQVLCGFGVSALFASVCRKGLYVDAFSVAEELFQRCRTHLRGAN
jgi:O-antigen/teichoic acid export membrane protein